MTATAGAGAAAPQAPRLASPAERMSPLFLELDCLSWGAETDRLMAESARLLAEHRPLWIRVANWADPTLNLLESVPGRRVVWKVEYTGYGAFDRRPDGGYWARDYVDRMFALDIDLTIYTYSQWNVDHLRRDIPALRDVEIGVVPMAQKPLLRSPDRPAARAAFGVEPADLVLGAGGALGTTWKGVDEQVDGFIATCHDPATKLLAQVIPHPARADQQRRWQASEAARDGRLVVRTGRYNDWPGVTEFYRALDCFLVNSTWDTWCRMLVEAIGYGIPAVAVRADCGTNTVVPGLTLVDQMTDYQSPDLYEAIARARTVAGSLRDYVFREYELSRVCRVFLAFLRRHTPEALLADFDTLAGNPRVLELVGRSLLH